MQDNKGFLFINQSTHISRFFFIFFFFCFKSQQNQLKRACRRLNLKCLKHRAYSSMIVPCGDKGNVCIFVQNIVFAWLTSSQLRVTSIAHLHTQNKYILLVWSCQMKFRFIKLFLRFKIFLVSLNNLYNFYQN